MRNVRNWVLLILVMGSMLLMPLASYADPGESNCYYPSLSERFGVTVRSDTNIDLYDVELLSAGRYLNWLAHPYASHPNQMHYYRMIRITENAFYPSGEQLTDTARLNPGTTWIIGNEADVIWQDNVTPEVYARRYHDAYETIIAADPTAKFVINGVVQVSELRLEWLNQVLAAYQNMYGTNIPVDMWNVHTYVGNEMHRMWGFDLPPGIDNAPGYTGNESGEWFEAGYGPAGDDIIHLSNHLGSQAWFAFHGSEVTVHLGTAPDAGIVEIFADLNPVPVATVDLYAPDWGMTEVTISGLTSDPPPIGDRHHIRLRVTGENTPPSFNTWVRVDAIEAPSTAGLPNGRLESHARPRAHIERDLENHDNIAMIEQQIRDFRQWMADHGQRDKPLIHTEYGILMPEEFGFDYPRVSQFMLNSFDLLAGDFTDPDTGYPADGNRLLQEWFWFSLAIEEFDGFINKSGLFDPYTTQIKALGEDFAGYVVPRSNDYVDLAAASLTFTSTWSLFASAPSWVQVEAGAVNKGTIDSGSFYMNLVDGWTTVSSQWFSGLSARYSGNASGSTNHNWYPVSDGSNVLVLHVDGLGQVDEPCESNNYLSVPLDAPPFTDLALSNPRTIPETIPHPGSGQQADVTILADLQNLGGLGTADNQVVIRLWRGDPDAGGVAIDDVVITPSTMTLPTTVQFDWTDVPPAFHDMTIEVIPVPEETNLDNNRVQISFLLSDHAVFIPTMLSGLGDGIESLDQQVELPQPAALHQPEFPSVLDKISHMIPPDYLGGE
ncbi:MAG: hypothetical protein U9R25_18225 [Chloroflexota bacterium]|nr:hypothetical protein [Chloroflexota bacterium]